MITYNKTVEPVNVRALADLIYIGGALGFVAGDDHLMAQLPRGVRAQMLKLFAEEFQGNGWVRAMSLKDSTAKNINCEAEACGVEDLVAMRAVSCS